MITDKEGMKVHLRQIPQGDILHIEGEEDAGPLGLEEAGATAVSPLRYALDVGTSADGLFATGRIAVRVRMRCVLCLADFEQDIEVDPFSLQMDLTGNELIDLTPMVREDIHLILPPHPRCDAAGGSKCPATYYEGASRTTQYSPEGAASAWDALDKIKQKSS